MHTRHKAPCHYQHIIRLTLACAAIFPFLLLNGCKHRIIAISIKFRFTARIIRGGQICAIEMGEWLHDHLNSFNPAMRTRATARKRPCFACMLISSSVDSKSVSPCNIPQIVLPFLDDARAKRISGLRMLRANEQWCMRWSQTLIKKLYSGTSCRRLQPRPMFKRFPRESTWNKMVSKISVG